ncbi:hypothetical protein HY546_03775 [archaeon]|nr:hypothetical protein [archaeon]
MTVGNILNVSNIANVPLNVSFVNGQGAVLNISNNGGAGFLGNQTNPQYVIADGSNITARQTTYANTTNGTIANMTWGAATGLRHHLSHMSFFANLSAPGSVGAAPLIIAVSCTGNAGTQVIWRSHFLTSYSASASAHEYLFPVPLNCSTAQNMSFEVQNRSTTGVLSSPFTAGDNSALAFINVFGYDAY